MALHKTGMIFDSGMIFFEFLDLVAHFLKYVSYGLFFIAPDPVHEGVARFHVQFYGGDTRSILAAVVLLFHQQVELCKTPQNGPILLLVIRKRLSQPYECHTAFVFDRVTHGFISRRRKGKAIRKDNRIK